MNLLLTDALEIQEIQLEAPEELKLFEPCARNMHDDCAWKTIGMLCACDCHLEETNEKEEAESW